MEWTDVGRLLLIPFILGGIVLVAFTFLLLIGFVGGIIESIVGHLPLLSKKVLRELFLGTLGFIPDEYVDKPFCYYNYD